MPIEKGLALPGDDVGVDGGGGWPSHAGCPGAPIAPRTFPTLWGSIGGTLLPFGHLVTQEACGVLEPLAGGRELPDGAGDAERRLDGKIELAGLAAGIITRVEPFDRGERRAFVEHIARRKRGGLPAWAIDRLAAVNASSVRVLLGCVNAAMALERAQKLDVRSLDASLAGVTVLDPWSPADPLTRFSVDTIAPGDSVAVIGCGGVGSAAIAGARLANAAKIIAIDLDDRKLEWATGIGATHTINAGAGDVVEAIQALTDGNGADVVIDAVGRPETWKQAFYGRDLAGTVVLVGVPTPEMRLEIPLIDVFGRGGALKSSWYGDCLPSRDFPMLVDLYLQGRLDLDAFVTETIGIDDVEAAFTKMHDGAVLRSVVEL